jgi:hypothetical protein
VNLQGSDDPTCPIVSYRNEHAPRLLLDIQNQTWAYANLLRRNLLRPSRFERLDWIVSSYRRSLIEHQGH